VRPTLYDHAGLPADAGFRAQLRAYMEWAVAGDLEWGEPGSDVPPGRPVPRWTWDGLAVAG
jgi:hemoglobin